MPRGKDEPKTNDPGSKALGGASNALQAARAYLTKKKGKEFTEIRVALDTDALKQSLPHIPSGCDVVDYLIGGQLNTFGVAPCPGFPRGRVTQIWGHESAGKTTLALEACAAVCAAGGTVLYIDWENDIVPDYAAALGVPITDSSKFELLQPETLESGIQFAMAYAAAGVDLIVFDSVGAAVPRRLAERDALETAEQGKVGELQAVWSQELPNLKRVIAKTGTAVIGISQLRAIIGAQANAAQTKPQGGNAWKYFASVRLELKRVQNEKAAEFNDLNNKREERIIGGIIKVTAVKCKMSRSQGREEIFYIRWGEGIDNIRTIIEIAAAHGIIRVKGSWNEWPDGPSGSQRWQGKEKMRTYFVEHEADYLALRERVLPLLGQGAADAFVEEDDEDATPGMSEAAGQDDKDDEIEKILGGAKAESAPKSTSAEVD